jgi:hypothetical protein
MNRDRIGRALPELSLVRPVMAVPLSESKNIDDC